MKTNTRNFAIAAAVAALLGCSSAPPRIDTVAMARSAVQQVESSPDAGKYAAAEVSAAHDALLEADRLVEKKKPLKEIDQAAYLAKRHADVATEQIARGQAEQQTAEAEAARQRVVLQAREQEATAARTQAEAARSQAELATERAQQSADASQRTVADLAQQLRDLQAKQTDRGLVLTLGDVLFDTGQATLKPGAAGTIDRLATFLTQAPERSVVIEGHTDSMGSDSSNMFLSESRANAVKAALVSRGIQADRVVAVGKGESVPVAGNENAAGRQQNRRVEIIVSNAPALAHRE